MALPQYPHISVEDYLILDNNATDARYEYLDGELRMLAGGTTDHSAIAMNIAAILHRHFSDTCVVHGSDMRLQVSESKYVYPDVMVSCDQRDRRRAREIHYPCIVVEILLPGTEMIDRITKLAYYRTCPTIQTYLLIDSQSILVDVYQRKNIGWLLNTFALTNTLVLEPWNIAINISDVYKNSSLVD